MQNKREMCQAQMRRQMYQRRQNQGKQCRRVVKAKCETEEVAEGWGSRRGCKRWCRGQAGGVVVWAVREAQGWEEGRAERGRQAVAVGRRDGSKIVRGKGSALSTPRVYLHGGM